MTVAEFYGDVLHALSALGIDGRDQRHAERDRRCDPVRRGPRARVLRPRLCQPLLAHPQRVERGVRAFPHRLPRQGEPGAFLLGQLRSRGDALLRPHARRAIPAACRTCPTTSRRKPIRTRSRARASGRAAARSTIRRSTPTPIRRRRASRRRRCGRRRRSSPRSSASSSCRTTRCARRPIRARRLMDFLQIDLRRGGRPRQMGPRGARMRDRRGEGGAAILAAIPDCAPLHPGYADNVSTRE